MSAKTCDSMSVDDLIDAYVRLGTSLGSLWSRKFRPAEKTAERMKTNEEL